MFSSPTWSLKNCPLGGLARSERCWRSRGALYRWGLAIFLDRIGRNCELSYHVLNCFNKLFEDVWSFFFFFLRQGAPVDWCRQDGRSHGRSQLAEAHVGPWGAAMYRGHHGGWVSDAQLPWLFEVEIKTYSTINIETKTIHDYTW